MTNPPISPPGPSPAAKSSPTLCRGCHRENQLDQWFEAPKITHLLCPTCASKHEFSRPIHINTVAARLLEAYGLMEKLAKENNDLKQLTENSPDMAKQLRKVAKSAESNALALNQVATMLTELTNNLSPRWIFSVKPEQMEAMKKLMTRLAEEAGPGAILQVTEEERELFNQLVKL